MRSITTRLLLLYCVCVCVFSLLNFLFIKYIYSFLFIDFRNDDEEDVMADAAGVITTLFNEGLFRHRPVGSIQQQTDRWIVNG